VLQALLLLCARVRVDRHQGTGAAAGDDGDDLQGRDGARAAPLNGVAQLGGPGARGGSVMSELVPVVGTQPRGKDQATSLTHSPS
jgi:hypothetical protein